MTTKSAPLSANERALIQPRELPLNISPEMCTGKTYIVTGANVGLGLEASRHLVKAGAAKVIMTARNLEAGEAARADVESTTGIKGVAEVWNLDLSKFASVTAFAEKAKGLERIDAIVQNAAVAIPPDNSLVEGHLPTLTVNVISTTLLAILLLPKLTADAAKFGYTPSISCVTSGTCFDMGDYWKTIAEDPILNMDNDENARLKSYPGSKIILTLALRHLAKLHPISRGVVLNIVDPGLCETTLSRNAPQQFKDHLQQMWEKCGRTAETGSRTLLAGVAAGKDSHGGYMEDAKLAEHIVPEWVDETAQKQAWTAVVKELEKIEPGCVAKALA